jgi:protein PhnA
MAPVLKERSNEVCELCGGGGELHAYAVPPKEADKPEHVVVLCDGCQNRIVAGDYSDTDYWRFLTGSIWSEVPSVQALSYKILGKLSGADWAAETLDSVAVDEEIAVWAGAEDALEAGKVVHKDAYGVMLESGDTVVLTQNLNVKGANFIAPKGTIVRKIRLVADNGEQIEGKINGDTIVILTKFVKKS